MSDQSRLRLSNRIALVTGGGSGIGEAISRLFAAEGAAIAVTDLIPERAERVAAAIRESGGKAAAYQIDVADATSVSNAVNQAAGELGTIDILVNNAAISVGDDILTIEPDVWDFNLGVVLRGPYLCSRAVLPGMLAQRRGAIVNISSVNGLTGLGEEAYGAAKAGLINLTQNMAVKYGASGVRANAIAPGTIRTPIWNDTLAKAPNVFENLAKFYPMQRVGEPEEVARAALFLASDDASFITGVTLPVDGGLMAGQYGMSEAQQGE